MKEKLFITPHYFDIVWGCSGYIYLNRDKSLVVNVFTTIPDKEILKKYKEYTQYEYRKPENEFRKMFQLDFLELDYKTAIERGRSPASAFTSILNDEENKIANEISKEISKLISQYKVKELYVPLSSRNNVDHIIVREAAHRIVEPIKIFYYIDFPNLEPEKTSSIPYSELEQINIDISQIIDKKIDAILLYGKSIFSYFKSKEKLIEALKNNPKEIYWKKI